MTEMDELIDRLVYALEGAYEQIGMNGSPDLFIEEALEIADKIRKRE